MSSIFDANTSDALPASFAAQACTSCRKQRRKCSKDLPSCILCLRLGRRCEYSTDQVLNRSAQDEIDYLRGKIKTLESRLAVSLQPETMDEMSVDSNEMMSSQASSTRSRDGEDSVMAGAPAIEDQRLRGTMQSSSEIEVNPDFEAGKRFPALFFLDYACFQHQGLAINQNHLAFQVPWSIGLGHPSEAEDLKLFDLYFKTVHLCIPISKLAVPERRQLNLAGPSTPHICLL